MVRTHPIGIAIGMPPLAYRGSANNVFSISMRSDCSCISCKRVHL